VPDRASNSAAGILFSFIGGFQMVQYMIVALLLLADGPTKPEPPRGAEPMKIQQDAKEREKMLYGRQIDAAKNAADLEKIQATPKDREKMLYAEYGRRIDAAKTDAVRNWGMRGDCGTDAASAPFCRPSGRGFPVHLCGHARAR
jgi:hypothetical protein